mgnify:FL=1
MAITTYSELVSAIANWLDRSDLSSRIPEFITLAEGHLDRVLRSRELITRATANVDEQYENLPRDFAEEIRLSLTSSNLTFQLKSMSPASLIAQFPDNTQGTPRAYAIVGPQIQFAPVPDASANLTMELTYYSKVSFFALSDSNTTNVILDQHKDIYLYSALAEAAPFLMDDKAAQRYVALRDASVQRANQANDDASYGGTLQMTHGMRNIG